MVAILNLLVPVFKLPLSENASSEARLEKKKKTFPLTCEYRIVPVRFYKFYRTGAFVFLPSY